MSEEEKERKEGLPTNWLTTERARYVLGVVTLILLALGAWWMLRDTSTPAEKGATAPIKEPPSNVAPEIRARIDRWIEEKGLNRYGDPPATRYPGGNPLFDPATSKYKDRYEYILEKHPELRK
jgi:hypothetical protein